MNRNTQHIITSPRFLYSENSLVLSDADSSTSLHRAQGLTSYSTQENTGIDKSLTDSSPEDIPMKRNNSYSMLDIEALSEHAAEAQDNVYSYPKLKYKVKQIKDSGYTTVGTKIDSDSKPYSKIELSNMYENITGEGDNMTDNQLYGVSEETFVPGLFDPYMNEAEYRIRT